MNTLLTALIMTSTTRADDQDVKHAHHERIDTVDSWFTMKGMLTWMYRQHVPYHRKLICVSAGAVNGEFTMFASIENRLRYSQWKPLAACVLKFSIRT